MMIQENPFIITFGKKPATLISREMSFERIYESFLQDNPDTKAYFVVGAKKSGKTVAMATIAERFKEYEKWIVVELNPAGDMLEQLASKLIDEGKLKKLFVSTEFSFSFQGFGFSLKGEEPVLNVSTLLKRELEYLKKKGYRVLITIDDVSSDDPMKIFAHEFQLFLRNGFPVFLLMTGLYSNINLLEKQKNLTFLVRAPRIYLGEFNYRPIVNSYRKVFGIGEPEAIELAKLTNGYAFAYQLLGHILFTQHKTRVDDDVMAKYDELLQERAYDFVYKELTEREKELLYHACIDNTNPYLAKQTGMKPSQLTNYKKELFRKGIIHGEYSKSITFCLPRFKEYLQFIQAFDE